MKNIRIRAAAILALCLLSAALAGQAPEAARVYTILREPWPRDWDFLAIRDGRLHPETNFLTNPALIVTIPASILILNGDLLASGDTETLTRADGSVGLKGGTMESSSGRFAPDLGFLSLKKKAKGGPSAFFASAALDLASVTVKKVNYDALSEYSVQTDSDGSGGFRLGSVGSGRTRTAYWGLAWAFDFKATPHSFRKLEDSSSGSLLTSWGMAIHPADSLVSGLDLSGGLGIPLSRSSFLGLALALRGSVDDASKAWRATDANGDGINESLLELDDYWLGLEPADPAEAVTAFSRRDLDLGFRAVFSPSLRIALSESLELHASADWSVLDLLSGSAYERFAYEGSPDGYADISLATSLWDSSLGSGSALVGLTIGKNRASLFRLGLAYGHSGWRRSQDGLDAVGNSTFSAYNPEHCPEAAIGTAPANGVVVAAAGLPWTRTEDSLSLLGAWEYRPSAAMSLFAEFGLGGERRMEEFRVFNLDTRTVWTEEAGSSGLSWGLRSAAGLSFDLGAGTRFILDCRVAPLDGGLGATTDALPFDLGANTDTANGSYDSVGDSPLSLRLRAGLTFVR